jgi:hypothetical protein
MRFLTIKNILEHFGEDATVTVTLQNQKKHCNKNFFVFNSGTEIPQKGSIWRQALVFGSEKFKIPHQVFYQE